MSSARNGIKAQVLGVGVQTVLQLVTIPLFLQTVGSAKLALWIVLTAIPSYLALSDLGLIGASATEMTKRVTRGQGESARALAGAASSATTFVFSMLLVAAIFAAYTTSAPLAIPGVHSGNLPEARLVIVGQVAYVLLLQQTAILEASFRAAGSFAIGIVFINIARLGEFAVVAAALFVGRTLTFAAVAYLAARFCVVVVLRGLLVRRHPDMMPKLCWQPWRELRPLARSGLGSLSFPISTGLSVQAMTIAVSATLGGTAVVELSALRIGTGLIRQLCNALNYGAMPRLTQQLAAGQFTAARALGRRVFRATLFLTTVSAVVLCLAGPTLIRLWTSGSVSPSFGIVLAMTGTVLADVPLLYFSMVLLASNTHARFGLVYVIGTGVSLGLAVLLLPAVGLVAVPIGLVAVDLIATPLAVRQARQQLRSQASPFSQPLNSCT